ncbi:MAG: ROK family transcriptional regulator [Clostridiales bacterium]|nr:ROK family transcriptional regulator [Clostridiales bacterium]
MEQSVSLGNSIIKEVHRQKVLQCVRMNQPISRTSVSQVAGISKPTVSRIVDELITDGLLIETGSMAASSKRKPTGLKINPAAFYCIGMNITKRAIRVAVVDFSAEPVYQNKKELSESITAEELTDFACAQLKNAIESSRIPPEKILGAGVGVAGIVDHTSGVIVNFASAGKLTNIPLKKILEENFPYRFFIDNETNTRILAEHEFGFAKGVDDCIFVTHREGLGSGVLSNGALLRGSRNITGEFGHTVINTQGRQCSCGKYGCIEAYCSTLALEKNIRQSVRHSRSTFIHPEEITCERIMQAFEEGDELCGEHVLQIANVLSTGISNLIHILNPSMVILCGDMFDHSPRFRLAVEHYAQEMLLDPGMQSPVFQFRSTRDTVYRIGAAALVFQNFFS